MAGIFSMDSKLSQILSRLWDLLLLNILWIVGSLPLVTAGAATIAAYDVGLRIVEDSDSGIVAPFFKAYKDNLLQGIALTLAYTVLIVAIVLDFMLFEGMEGNPTFLLIIGILSAVLIHVHFFYVFALAARYRNNLYRHLTNSRRIFVRFFGKSMFCTVLVAAEIWLFFFNGWLMLFVGAFIAPVLIFTTISSFAIRMFHKIESEGGVMTEAEDSENTDEAGSTAETDSDTDNETEV